MALLPETPSDYPSGFNPNDGVDQLIPHWPWGSSEPGTRNVRAVIPMCSRVSILTTWGPLVMVNDKRRVPVGVPRGSSNSLGVTDLITGTVPCDGIGSYNGRMETV